MGTITPEERAVVRSRSPVGAKYDNAINRESAHEILARKTQGTTASVPDAAPPGPSTPQTEKSSDIGVKLREWLWGTKRRQGMIETMAKQTARTVGSQIGRKILRGVLGGILNESHRR